MERLFDLPHVIFQISQPLATQFRKLQPSFELRQIAL